jgi:glyoxylase-like metal-dependent hydrolase (beta-lactamase superfamily II)
MPERAIGDLRIARVMELSQPFPIYDFFPDSTEEDWAPHREWLIGEGAMSADGANIILPMQSYVVRTSHHTILIDTCVGNHKERPTRPDWHQKTDSTWMNNLAALGLTPDDIDFVMCTHLHVDHVGWNTKLVDGRWVPTFPNARYLFSGKELEAFQNVPHPAAAPSLGDSVLPVVEAGQADLVTSDYALDDEVWLEPTPGHTPDHFAVRLHSCGADAVVAGDLMHSPVQLLHPEWRPRPDFDPALAMRTRQDFMARHAELQSLVCMMHFPLPSAGYFVPITEGFRFDYDREKW